MPMTNILITLLVVAVLLWLVNTYLPMPAKIKQVVNIVAVVLVLLWVANVFGLLGHFGNARLGRG